MMSVVTTPLLPRQMAHRLMKMLRSSHTHTHVHLTALCPGLPGWAGTRKVKPIWILLKQETVSGSGISWAICKSASRSRRRTTPAPHHSVFYRPDALPAAQPTASKHCFTPEGTKNKSAWLKFLLVSLIVEKQPRPCAELYQYIYGRMCRQENSAWWRVHTSRQSLSTPESGDDMIDSRWEHAALSATASTTAQFLPLPAWLMRHVMYNRTSLYRIESYRDILVLSHLIHRFP